MSTRKTRNRRRRLLRQKLEKKCYEYVKEYDRLPSSTMLMRYAEVRYIQARKFIKKKKNRGQWKVDSIIKAQGKITKKKKKQQEPKKEETVKKQVEPKKEEEKIEEKEAVKEEVVMTEPVKVAESSSEDEEIEEKEVEEAKQEEVSYVTRRAIRKMPKEDVDRFFDAVDTMMKAKNGPGSSEFFRLASYHGMPRPIYCQHGRETFPGWHRIYLQQFELALQIADKENGNDGRIGLPYWDWTTNPKEGLPSAIRERFKAWPDDLFPKEVPPQYPLKRDNDQNIGGKLEAWGTIQSAYDCLLATQHFAHASTGDELQYPSVEHSHNHLHVIVGGNGGTMSSVAWAAYDIAFWLHHNNVDRIYESYLAIEPDSAEEFENYQEQQSVDLFDGAFTPFKKENGEYYYPRDTFDTKAIGYVYDALIKPQPMQLREAPVLVLFRNVKVYEFESKCYQIHVYVVDKSKADEFKEPTKSDEIDIKNINYAGGEAIFGRGMECSNCMTRPPVDLMVDITATLRKLSVSRYNVDINVYIEETTDDSDVILKLSDTPLPEPTITGPIFEDVDKSSLDEKQDELGPNNENEVRALQRFLQRFGYYDDDAAVDGKYGTKTAQGVKDYQEAAGLKNDGIAGPKTKNSIVQSRRCSNKDGFANNNAKDIETADKHNKTEISYFIDVNPGYLQRDKVEETMAAAFKCWSDVSSLTFKFLDDDDDENVNKADIKLKWIAGQSSDNRLGFDGAGGILGHGGKGFVDFDISERWVYGLTDDDEKELSVLSDPNTWYRGQPTVSLFYVAVHEIGHALGLDHSMSTNDIMGPYYSPKIKKLSNNDIKRIQTLYPKQ